MRFEFLHSEDDKLQILANLEALPEDTTRLNGALVTHGVVFTEETLFIQLDTGQAIVISND